MSLLDSEPTAAYTTIRIDHGAQYGARRYGGWAPVKYLDNASAFAYAEKYPLGSTVFQWDGAKWRELGT